MGMRKTEGAKNDQAAFMGVSYGGTRHLTFTSTTKKNPFKL